MFVETGTMERTENTNSAAVLMLLLGKELAASVMSHLDQAEVQQISSAMLHVEGRQTEYIDRLEQLLNAHESAREAA
jgi:flagellar motor switch protein FliG